MKAEFHVPETKTLRFFLETHRENNTLPARLLKMYENAEWLEKKLPDHSILDLALSEISFERLGKVKGVGPVTWQDFVRLRGY